MMSVATRASRRAVAPAARRPLKVGNQFEVQRRQLSSRRSVVIDVAVTLLVLYVRAKGVDGAALLVRRYNTRRMIVLTGQRMGSPLWLNPITLL